ncbi:MAG: biotin--[acetyl-CoA-carboxylase] ligase [Chitinispirillaceae bacterium]
MLPHALNGLDFVERFYSFEEIDSTNEYAKKLRHTPQKGIYIIQAEKQSAGRGRRGNSFFSSHNGGLWISIVTSVKELSDHFIHNRAISLAICETLKKRVPQKKISIKWPNDIYWDDRKIAGILLERTPASENSIIVGFGLNVNIPEDAFPHNLQHCATSLLRETGTRHSSIAILRKILRLYHHCCIADQKDMHGFYRNNLYKVGYKATLDNVEGVFENVEQNGRILIRTPNGPRAFSSGTLRFYSGGENV